VRTCIVCGCTDDFACVDGCSWTKKIGKSEGICSACPIPVPAKKLTVAQQLERKRRTKDTQNLARKRRELEEQLSQVEIDYDVTVESLRDFEDAMAGR
jgi:hypothetical protein